MACLRNNIPLFPDDSYTMIDGKSVIASIPARGGSKGLPGKNIRNLCGKPLIAWTIEIAKKSRYLDKIVVSTDTGEIADIAVEYGAEIPYLRPSSLALDDTPTYAVVEHMLEWYQEKEGHEFDITVLLEPTSPLRERDDIDNMLDMLTAQDASADSIISIGRVAEHPSIVKKLSQGKISPFCPELKQTTRRQDNQPAFFPYGVAYIARTPVLCTERTFYTQRCMGYEIKRYQNYEIDDIYDFICVENIMKYEWQLI